MGLERITQPQQFDAFITTEGSRSITQASSTVTFALSTKEAIASGKNLFVLDPTNFPTNPFRTVFSDGGNFRTVTDQTMILGTNSDQHLRIRTGGSTNNEIRMTILSSGEVGIGTTIARTNQQQQLSGASNGAFTNTTGMAFNGSDWYGNTVPNWGGGTDPTYTVYFNGTNYFRNLGAGPTTSSSPMSQRIGTLQVRSDVIVSFTNSVVPFGARTLSAAIFNSSNTSLASGAYDGSGNYTLSAGNVPAGTTIIIGFWGTAGITNISLSTTLQSGYLTINGGLSAGYTNTSRLEVREGYVVLRNLPTSSAGLPSGAVYNNSGILQIVA